MEKTKIKIAIKRINNEKDVEEVNHFLDGKFVQSIQVVQDFPDSVSPFGGQTQKGFRILIVYGSK